MPLIPGTVSVESEQCGDEMRGQVIPLDNRMPSGGH